MANVSGFIQEAFVDFPDDACCDGPLTPQHIDTMMRRLKEFGIQRVSWEYYGDGHGGFYIPAHMKAFQNMAVNYHTLGNPLRIAVEAAHRHGLEIYGYFKPYETGPALSFPEGSFESMTYGRLSQLGGTLSWMDRFVTEHPHLRIRRRSGDLPANIAKIPVCGIKLVKRDDSPTRLTADHLQIWTCDRNYQYRPIEVSLTCEQTVEIAERDVVDLQDRLITRKGDRVRVLKLSGFELTAPYILVTTDFQDNSGDFSNTDTEIMVALDRQGKEIPGVFATGTAIWNESMVNFREGGVMFDHGYGRQLTTLDESNADGKKGFIAYCRGRNEYLPAALCETEPEVQNYWLTCIDEILATGVDGIDFREESHSTHTNYPEDYGYNAVVLDRCKERGSVNPAMIAQVRGEAYTEFLRRAKKAINAAGKKMRIHFQIDYYRPKPPTCRLLAYSANLNFEWRRWIDEGLTDEAVLRFFALPFSCIYEDDVAKEFIERCQNAQLPIAVNRYVCHTESLCEEFQTIRNDGRFAGFIFYETANFMSFGANGECKFSLPVMDEVRKLVNSR